MEGGAEMKTILAAVDNSLAGRPVIATASALAKVLGAHVEAVHVRVNGDRTARSAAEAAGISLRSLAGPVVERLVAAGTPDEVVAMAIGARGIAPRRHAMGGTAAAVATELCKPIAIVPPDASVPTLFRRVLVPLEGPLSSTPAPSGIFDLARDTEIDVITLHVLDEDSIPLFTDQPQHEHLAWAREFLARYFPSGLGQVRLETRVGRSEELVPAVAEECGCDVIALGWSQELAPGRAPVVRGTLERSRLPVILVPVQSATDAEQTPALSAQS
jgi:nucleotide-binding universal stress UspA family protein